MGTAPARLRAGNGLAIFQSGLGARRRRRGESVGPALVRVPEPLRVRAAADDTGYRVFADRSGRASRRRRCCGLYAPRLGSDSSGAEGGVGLAIRRGESGDAADRSWPVGLEPDRPLASQSGIVQGGILAGGIEVPPYSGLCPRTPGGVR